MKNVYLLFICFLTTAVLAQGSVTASHSINIGSVAKGKMWDVYGWLQNDAGKWISGRNKIPANLEAQFKNLSDFEQNGLGENGENFTYMELRDVTIYDSLYTILIKKYKDGYYKNPAYHTGWTPQNSITYYVFRTNELEKLKGLDKNKLYNVKINTLYCRTIRNIDPKFSTVNIAQDLAKVISGAEAAPFKEDLMVTLKLNKDNVRFLITTCVSYTAPFDLIKYYYETPTENFTKLFKLE